jgi:DNA-binding MarR family transcriptional regulator
MSNEKIRQQLRNFNTVIKETDAVYGELAKQSGLSDCAFWLMYSLREADGKCTQKELCDQWVISKQTVNSALKGLEKSGYVSLISSETDKRNKYITLTDKGILFARKNIDIVFELEELAFNKMSVAERAAIIEISQKYQKLLRSETERFLKK